MIPQRMKFILVLRPTYSQRQDRQQIAVDSFIQSKPRLWILCMPILRLPLYIPDIWMHYSPERQRIDWCHFHVTSRCLPAMKTNERYIHVMYQLGLYSNEQMIFRRDHICGSEFKIHPRVGVSSSIIRSLGDEGNNSSSDGDF